MKRTVPGPFETFKTSMLIVGSWRDRAGLDNGSDHTAIERLRLNRPLPGSVETSLLCHVGATP